jgi:glycosyltransferase involved in cell wall biosynthesis
MEIRIPILYVFAALPVGGAEQLLVAELEGLDKKLFSPLVCVISEKGPIGELIEKMGFPVIPLHRMRRNQFDYGIIRELKKLMIQERVSIVHTHLYDGGKYGRIAAGLAKIPVIIHTVHNIYVKRRSKHHWFNWGLSFFSDRIIAVSEAVKASVIHYDHISPKKIEVIYNGIDLSQGEQRINRSEVRAQLGIRPEEMAIGVVARLEEQKGHKVLLEALSQIPELPPSLKVLIIGDGKLRSQLEQDTLKRGLSSQVIFLGTRKPIFPILKALDLFLLPSLWEGFSMAILEAMAMGLPVIATKVGGAEEVITSGQHGLLIPPGDAPRLAEAIQDALLHRDKYLKMARMGQERVTQNFSKERHVSLLQDLYLAVLTQKALNPGKKS